MEIKKAIKETNINKYYSLKEYFCSDVDTFAFPKEEAIKIINYLREDFFPVTGLTLWILDGEDFKIGCAWWTCDEIENENPYSHLKRSCDTAIKYIEDITDDSQKDNFLWEIDFSRMKA